MLCTTNVFFLQILMSQLTDSSLLRLQKMTFIGGSIINKRHIYNCALKEEPVKRLAPGGRSLWGGPGGNRYDGRRPLPGG